MGCLVSRIRLQREGEEDAEKYSAILILAKIQLSFLNSPASPNLVPRAKKFLRVIAFLGQEK